MSEADLVWEREESWRQLANAIVLRSSEEHVLWTIFGANSAANAVLLVALFQGGHLPSSIVGETISLFGVLITLEWLLIQTRSQGHSERYEALIMRLDKQLTKGIEGHSLFSKEDFGWKLQFPKGRHVMEVTVLLLLLSWIVALLYFFVGAW